MRLCKETILMLLVAMLGASPAATWSGFFTKKKLSAVDSAHAGDEWRSRENLVERLAGEWDKISTLRSDLGDAADILSEIRSIELFPAGVTKMGQADLVAFDKDIEKVEKKEQAIAARIDAMSPPLSDAAAILKEMVAGQPVKEMFEVIEQGNLDRISAMLSIKHQIDTLWYSIDSLMNSVAVTGGIQLPRRQTETGMQDEFLEIISANLGMTSQSYYRKLSNIQDSLAERATRSQIAEMYPIEVAAILRHLDQHNNERAARKLSSLINRYERKFPVDNLYLLLARAQFGQGVYEPALSTLSRIPDSAGASRTAKVLYRAQCWRLLKNHEALWKWGSKFDFKQLTGKDLNLALWLVMESGFELGKTDSLSRLAALASTESPYLLQIMHTLARSFSAAGDYATALSVLERALRVKQPAEADRAVYARINLAAAQTLYELGRFDKALTTFFDLINNETMYDEALTGIIWCYINLGMYDKAELSLRKLINQDAASPRAADAILIMGRRLVSKAQYEWRKTLSLSKEQRRLQAMLDRIDLKMRLDTSSATVRKMAGARSDITGMLAKLQAEPRDDYQAIASYYDKAEATCDLIDQFYRTGSFQEISFSKKREKLLHQLDSLMLIINSGAAHREQTVFAGTRENIEAIKTIVKQGNLFKVELQIDRYRWERDYLDWQKESIKLAAKDLAQKTAGLRDSTSLARAAEQQARYARIIDSLVVKGDDLHRLWDDRLTVGCTMLLSKQLPLADEQYIQYHLGELKYAGENAEYLDKYTSYEAAQTAYDSLLTLYRKGAVLQMPEKPDRPVLSHAGSMGEYRRAIAADVDPLITSAAHYSLAWCFSDLGRYDSAIVQMTVVADEYPNSQYAPQAWMYIGEHAFENGRLQQASAAYQAVLKYPESQWFDEALYKYAWTQYRLSNPEKAISSFLALVDLGEKSSTGKALLEKESMDYIAISFSEADMTGEKGLLRATRFIERFGDIEKGTLILSRLAGVYKEQGRFDMAEKTYRKFLALFPAYYKAPAVERDLLSVQEKSLSPEQAYDAKMAFFKKYGRTGAWYRAQTDTAARLFGDSIAAEVLYDAAISCHQRALQKNDSSFYRTAARTYETYMRNYPASPFANECHYNLAEIMFSLGDYYRAAEEYIAVSKRYPGSKYQETAAWNAIVASQNLLKAEGARKE